MMFVELHFAVFLSVVYGSRQAAPENCFTASQSF